MMAESKQSSDIDVHDDGDDDDDIELQNSDNCGESHAKQAGFGHLHGWHCNH
jgi:hypothetical protein